MTTTAELLLKTAELLKGVRYGVSTATGSATTLVDTAMDEPDDWFNGGTIWFLSGALIGKTAVISDYAIATKTFTVPTQSGATGSGTKYAALDANYNREALIAAINTALVALGPFDTIDDTLDVVADQEEYTIPTGMSNVKRIQVGGSDSAPYQWSAPLRHWKEIGGKIEIEYSSVAGMPAAGYPIRLIGEKQHAAVSADADAITAAVDPWRIALEAAYYAALTRSGYAENTDGTVKDTLERLDKLRMMNPPVVRRMSKDPTLSH